MNIPNHLHRLRPALMPWLALLLGAAAGGASASLASPDAAASHLAIPDQATMRAALKLRLPKTPINNLNCQGFGGLCEVVSNKTLFYVDASARLLIVGRVYDMESRQDLTAARLLALNPDLLAASGLRQEASSDNGAQRSPPKPARTKVSLSGLPAKGAIVWGPDNGPRAVVISDFKCSYCKRLSTELQKVGARVEERPISIFGADSRRIAEAVLCAADQPRALRAAFAGEALPQPQHCDVSGLDANEAFAKANGFGGTPVIVRPRDGAVLEGYRDAAELARFLAEPSK
jgi:thiol:disulfide interchange protein DsbC